MESAGLYLLSYLSITPHVLPLLLSNLRMEANGAARANIYSN